MSGQTISVGAFAMRLKISRALRGESLQDVADAVGISKPHVWDMETGRSDNPGLKILRALAQHFGVTVSWLIGEDGASRWDIWSPTTNRSADHAVFASLAIDAPTFDHHRRCFVGCSVPAGNFGALRRLGYLMSLEAS